MTSTIGGQIDGALEPLVRARGRVHLDALLGAADAGEQLALLDV